MSVMSVSPNKALRHAELYVPIIKINHDKKIREFRGKERQYLLR